MTSMAKEWRTTRARKLARPLAEALSIDQCMAIYERLLEVASTDARKSGVQIPVQRDAIAYHVRTAIIRAAHNGDASHAKR